MVFVLFALVGAFGLHVRSDGIFSCPAGGYGKGVYLANCNAADYGEYDHGALWFGLHPAATRAAKAADVLFIGNSRLQFGFSSPPTGSWFSDQGRSYYLLGFEAVESSHFFDALLPRLQPRARAYVINSDDFFRAAASIPGTEVMTDLGAHRRMLIKAAWQPLHRLVCGVAAPLCGRAVAVYRETSTGQWRLLGDPPRYPIERADLAVDEAKVEQHVQLAEPFIAGLPVDRSCVILTYVWTTANERATAEAVAQRLGVAFVSPELDDLATFDGSHLDPASAERFAAAFFAEAGPKLASCTDPEATELAAGAGAP